MQLNARQYEALCAICDTFVPAFRREDDPYQFWGRAATDQQVPQSIVQTMPTLTTQEQRELTLLLDLCSSQLLGLTCWGPFRPLIELPLHQRERILRIWADSRSNALRKAFEQLRRMIVFLAYSAPAGHTNPFWPAIGYPGPLPTDSTPSTQIQPTYHEEARPLSCDVVVIGSGAGGGVAAAELAAAGYDVIVVEKGQFITEQQMNQSERDMVNTLYDKSGHLFSRDGGLHLFAGSCVGGGTTVNWAGAFRTAPAVLREWAHTHQLPHLTNGALEESYRAVASAISVDPSAPTHNPQNQQLAKGLQALGYEHGIVPRNELPYTSEQQWKAAGFSQLGGHEGNKQGTYKTYLSSAYKQGARLLPQTTAMTIVTKHGQATGVQVTQRRPDGTEHSFLIQSKRVVVAAGSIHTPSLLLRSGFQHKHIGKHLHVHPAVLVSARYPQPIRSWWGPMMSTYSDAFATQTEQYGVKIETAPLHPGLLALSTPWRSGWQHKERMLEAEHLGHFVLFARDKGTGKVTLDRHGQPRIDYRLSSFDLRHVLVGMAAATNIHLAAGAQRVYLPHRQLPTVHANDAPSSIEERFAALARTYRWEPNDFPLFSAHQMGTCRMGGDATLAPLTAKGALRECEGVYVTDGSAFPSSCGTNPMLTIMAMAHHTSQHIKASLAS